jgi:uncharacterized protein
MDAPPPTLDAPPPPPPPEPADAEPRWPLWVPVAGLASGFLFGALAVSILAGVLSAAGVDTDADSPGLTAGGTVIFDLSIVAATLLFAGLTARLRPWQLGLRGASLRYSAQIAAIGALAYILFGLVYQAIVRSEQQQDVVDNLGADRNTLLLVVGALVVIVVAPVCEEIFFRGVLYRVLRIRLGLWVAAIIDGLFFGLVHGSSSPLSALPVLAVLGIMFCWVYERTGTLFASIALHALNNTISYGYVTDDGWAVALAVGGVTIGACVVGVLRAPRGAPAPV